LSPTTRDRRAAIALTAVALAPVIATVVCRAGRSYLPVQDIAVIDLRIRDVFTVHTPLVGAYSRYGWNHPGPLMFYLLGPLSALAGGAAWATLVGAALLQGLAVVLAAWLAWRRGGLPLTMGVLAAIMLAYLATGPWIMLEAWNPHVAFPFLALFILQIWSIGEGDRWEILGAALVGSFLVQTHIGYAPLVVAGAVVAAFTWAKNLRDGTVRRGAYRLPLAAAVGATVVLWIPPMVEQLTSPRGNFSRIGSYFVGGGGGTVAGFGTALGLLAAEFRFVPPWLGGSDLQVPFIGSAAPASKLWLLLPAVLLAGGYLALRGRRSRSEFRLLCLVTVLLGVGLVAIGRSAVPAFAYLFYWRIMLATMFVLAVGWVLWVRWRQSMPGIVQRACAVTACAAIISGSSYLTVSIVHHSRYVSTFEQSTGELVAQLRAHGLPEHPVLIRTAGSPLGGVQGGIIDEMDRLGVPVKVDDSKGFQFGYQRTATPAQVQSIWYVVEQGQVVSTLTSQANARVLARTTPLTSAEETELVDLQRQLASELVATDNSRLLPVLDQDLLPLVVAKVPGINEAAVKRVTALDRKVEQSGVCRCAVVAFPAPPH
jgi:hypothetical protein